MSGFPTSSEGESGAFCPEPPADDRWDEDDRRADFAPCCQFSAASPSRPYCVCGVHRSWHFAALAEQAGWSRYATVLMGKERRW